VRLTQRLLLGSFLIVSVLVALIVVLSGGQLRRQLLAGQIEQLEREARYAATEWQRQVHADSLANAVGAVSGHRITLIAPDGEVVGDSFYGDDALAAIDNHSSRPEVVDAIRDGRGLSRRPSTTTGEERLYFAVAGPSGVARASMPTGEIDALVRRAQRVVLGSGLVALVLALGIAYAFSRGVSRPVVELRDVAQALAGGDLSRRPSLTAPGEVGDLAAALHRMAEQLDTRLRELQSEEALLLAVIDSLNQGVLAVDARRQVVAVNEVGRRLLGLRQEVPLSLDLLPRDRQLREAITAALQGDPTEQTELQLEGRTLTLTARPLPQGGAVIALFDLTAVRRLEAVRRDFVANVSHELKTPLTVIGGFAETLVTDEMPAAQQRAFAETIRANAQRMQRIVDDLLDLSRIESGGWLPNPHLLDARIAATEATLSAQRRAEELGITLRVEIAPDATHLWVDATAFRQIVTNLVENSLRYTPREGEITVGTARERDGTILRVRDNGSGIAAEHLSRIFERFYRADPARSREDGGTGLGLAIVKHLVEAHGGRVHAESAPGEGTVITAWFPDENS
jgi:two-component system, OmpR family, phosphate regulon sensor histidine kinase PhoR